MSQRYIGGLIYNPPGGYSGYFDGSGDYLTISSSTAFNFGTGDFTVEAFIYPLSFPTEATLISTANPTDFQGITINVGTNSGMILGLGSGGSWTVLDGSTGTGTVPVNQWHHIALTRSGNVFRFFINGVQTWTTTNSISLTNTNNALTIGGRPSIASGQYYNGYMSNVRVVKGTAVYTTAFTPPNGPLQNITNTSLLTCRYPTFVDGSSNAFTITVNGNTTVSTQNPFPLTTLPNPAQGGAGNGIFSMSQYQSLKQQNLWPTVDPYFDYTTLLLHGNGTNGGQNNTFLDSGTANSGSGFTITRNGNTTQGTFSPFSQTGWGYYFNGDANSFMRFADSGSVLDLPGDFTIEFWTYQPALATLGTTANLFFTVDTLDRMQMYQDSSNVGFLLNGSSIITSSTKAALNTWAHYAVVRSGSTVTMYLNGTSIGSGTSSYSMTCSTIMLGGQDRGGSTAYHGCNAYISNFRIVKGTAVYTAAFTPPTAPLTAISGTSLLTCQSNRFVDNSGNALAVTPGSTPSVQAFSPFAPTTAYSASTVGGSGYFDGSGDYLTFPDSASFDYSTGDFTCDMWVYPTTVSGDKVLLQLGSYGSGQTGIVFLLSNGGKVFYGYNGGFGGESSGSVLINTWSYLSFVRSSGTLKMYVNGVEKYSTSFTSSIAPSTDFSIGSNLNPLGSQFSGYLTSVRLSNTARSSSVPTTPITNDGNTQLLLNFTNAAIIDNTAKNVLETVADAQISTAQSKFGGASLYFDGTGDYLLMPTTEAIKVGGGDFTIEFWLYWASSLTPSVYWASSTSSILITDSAATYAVICSSTDTASGYSKLIDAPSSLSANTWGHVAVVRSSGTTRIYLNGTVGGNTSSITGSFDCAWIGYQKNGGRALNGYIDDLRITKGIARYTSNFTPQTSQWQDQ